MVIDPTLSRAFFDSIKLFQFLISRHDDRFDDVVQSQHFKSLSVFFFTSFLISVYLRLSLSLSPALSVSSRCPLYPYLTLSLSLSPSFYLFASLPLCLSHMVSLYPALSLCFPLLSFYLLHTLCLPLSISLSVSLTFSLNLQAWKFRANFMVWSVSTNLSSEGKGLIASSTSGT